MVTKWWLVTISSANSNADLKTWLSRHVRAIAWIAAEKQVVRAGHSWRSLPMCAHERQQRHTPTHPWRKTSLMQKMCHFGTVKKSVWTNDLYNLGWSTLHLKVQTSGLASHKYCSFWVLTIPLLWGTPLLSNNHVRFQDVKNTSQVFNRKAPCFHYHEVKKNLKGIKIKYSSWITATEMMLNKNVSLFLAFLNATDSS